MKEIKRDEKIQKIFDEDKEKKADNFSENTEVKETKAEEVKAEAVSEETETKTEE